MFRELDRGNSSGVISPGGVGIERHVSTKERSLIVDIRAGNIESSVQVDDWGVLDEDDR